jgi:hypothetical protein
MMGEKKEKKVNLEYRALLDECFWKGGKDGNRVPGS